MPFDKAGKHHLNAQKAAHSDKASAPPAKPAVGKREGAAPAQPPTEGEPHLKTFDHGDGTGHTETMDGVHYEHGDIEGTKAKLQALLEEEQGEGEMPTTPAHHMPVTHGHMTGL